MTDYCKMAEGLDKLSNKKIKRIFLTSASKTANELLYRMGRKKPHYPVPAIILQVEYTKWRIFVWRMWPHGWGYSKSYRYSRDK